MLPFLVVTCLLCTALLLCALVWRASLFLWRYEAYMYSSFTLVYIIYLLFYCSSHKWKQSLPSSGLVRQSCGTQMQMSAPGTDQTDLEKFGWRCGGTHQWTSNQGSLVDDWFPWESATPCKLEVQQRWCTNPCLCLEESCLHTHLFTRSTSVLSKNRENRPRVATVHSYINCQMHKSEFLLITKKI